MSNYVCVDIEKLKSLLPEIVAEVLLKVVVDGKCGGEITPTVPPKPLEPIDPIDKPVKPLPEYLWENSDELVPGKAILMPSDMLTGDILTVSVNDEELTFHSVWRNGREIWYGTNGIDHYGDAVIRIETNSTIYLARASSVVDGVDSSGDATETLRYHGRYNGDRPTWYGSKKMSEYPRTMRVIIPGCVDRLITHDGKRYDDGSLIIKQSDVSGRGVAIVFSSSCKSTKAYLEY